MQDYPHHYAVSASAQTSGAVVIQSDGLNSIDSAPPAQFGGPGDLWSPETFLVAAVADCFILTFRAIARASKLEWIALTCEVDGILDREGKKTSFTELNISASLSLPVGADEPKAVRLLEKAEQNCLITNSLKSKVNLKTQIALKSGNDLSA